MAARADRRHSPIARQTKPFVVAKLRAATGFVLNRDSRMRHRQHLLVQRGQRGLNFCAHHRLAECAHQVVSQHGKTQDVTTVA